MPTPLKDLYTKDMIESLAASIAIEWGEFRQDEFTKHVLNEPWKKLELKARMRKITESLYRFIPLSYSEAIAILKPASEANKEAFLSMYFPEFAELYGQDDWETSMDALAHFTKFSSSEFAIRPYLIQQQERGMAQMLAWSMDQNYHVRRLASEGCRPRLPWAQALPELKKDPSPILPILENLKNDPELYVRRSVANNINDISKDNPDVALDLGERWIGNNTETDWIVKHALRTLLKQGNERALDLFGFATKNKVKVVNLNLRQSELSIGDDLHFNFDLHVDQDRLIRLEYIIDFVKSNGKTSAKVFQISEKSYPKGPHTIARKQAIKHFSTRTIYPGTHGVRVLVNGVEKAAINFEVNP